MAVLLKHGDRGAEVTDLRARLASIGHDSAPDEPGTFGVGTGRAVRDFQESRKIRVDGICGPQTWSALVEAGFRLGDRLVYLRSPMLRGDDVAELQMRLGGLGFDTGRVDGIFGPETEAALFQFQRNVGLVPDGIFGKATGEALVRLGARGGGPSLMAEVKERVALRGGSRTLVRRRVSLGHCGDAGPLVGEIARGLRTAGATVVVIEEPDGSHQAAQANAAQSSVHVSFALDPDANGGTVAYYSGFRFESQGGRSLAGFLESRLSSSVGGAVGEVGMSIPVLRETRMTAVACEIGPPDRIAATLDLVASGVVEALGEWAAESWE